jgi:hypothetical protein
MTKIERAIAEWSVAYGLKLSSGCLEDLANYIERYLKPGRVEVPLITDQMIAQMRRGRNKRKSGRCCS